jgi:hypothetical protein
MRSGRITVLVVWKTDRIDRKLNTIHMIKEAVEAGSRIEFVTQPHLNDLSFHASSATPKLITAQNFARYQCQKLILRI